MLLLMIVLMLLFILMLLLSSLMPTCLWPPISHRYIDVVVDDGVDVVVYIDFVVVLTNADMSLATYVSQVHLRCC